ncbi:MAG: helix-turn-helix domain-containing protein [Hyphomonas sp.]|uniref:TetR/AcrR family transcriptional regulator n=1 Tax=Hyphomonas sp. TaxID=87 RepID=UPI0032EF058C
MPDKQFALSPLRQARRDLILERAEILFVQRGVRATTMEAVAEAAGMSKVTVYGYFQDKHLLFENVAERVASRLCDVVLEALAHKGDPEKIIANGLIAKHLFVWELVRASVFASELFAAKSEFAAGAFKRLDETIEGRISNILRQHRVHQPGALARIVFGAANGVANRATSKLQLKRDLYRLLSELLRQT